MINLEFKVKITPIITVDDDDAALKLFQLLKQLGIVNASKVKSYKDEDGTVHLHFD